MENILRLMIKDKRFEKDIKKDIGDFLLEYNDTFKVNLLYSKYINYTHLIKLLNKENIEKKEKDLMVEYFINSEFVTKKDKDKIMSELSTFKLKDRNIKSIFNSEGISIETKRKYLNEYILNEDIYNYAWNEDIPEKWIEKDFNGMSDKTIFNKLLSYEITKIPQKYLKLDYILENLNNLNLNDEVLTEEQLKIKKIYYIENDLKSMFYELPIEEIKKFLKLDFDEQKKIFKEGNSLLSMYKFINKEFGFFNKNDINEDISLEYKLFINKYESIEIKKIIKKEINDYYIKHKEEKDIKLTKSIILKSIILNNEYKEELLKHKDKLNKKELISYMNSSKMISNNEIIDLIKNSDKKDDIASIFFNEGNELTSRNIKYLDENKYINEQNIYFVSNYVHTSYEKVFDKHISGKNGKYIYENQKLSKGFMKKNINTYINKDSNNFYEVAYNQENLPKKFINYLKEEDEIYLLLSNTNYMFTKDIKGYKSDLLKLLTKREAGGIKFDAIIGYILNGILKKNNIRIEMVNSYPKLISNEEYKKKYSHTLVNDVENNCAININIS